MAIERIVVASDKSETASRAVAWAAEMAQQYGAQLTIVQAVVPGRRRPEQRLSSRSTPSGCAPGHARPRRRRRRSASAIIAAAEAEDADVLVVGNIGMAGRKEFLLGNVPNRVSHNARCTVVIVNTAEEPKKRRFWSSS